MMKRLSAVLAILFLTMNLSWGDHGGNMTLESPDEPPILSTPEPEEEYPVSPMPSLKYIPPEVHNSHDCAWYLEILVMGKIYYTALPQEATCETI